MSAKHTPGLLHVDPKRSLRIATDQDESLASTGTSDVLRDSWEANARRLVACWNACDGIDTEYLEGDDSLPHYARRLMAQRDELLAALEKIAGFTLSQFMGPHDMALECVTVACAAIAKVEGGKS